MASLSAHEQECLPWLAGTSEACSLICEQQKGKRWGAGLRKDGGMHWSHKYRACNLQTTSALVFTGSEW